MSRWAIAEAASKHCSDLVARSRRGGRARVAPDGMRSHPSVRRTCCSARKYLLLSSSLYLVSKMPRIGSRAHDDADSSRHPRQMRKGITMSQERTGALSHRANGHRHPARRVAPLGTRLISLGWVLLTAFTIGAALALSATLAREAPLVSTELMRETPTLIAATQEPFTVLCEDPHQLASRRANPTAWLARRTLVRERWTC